MPPLPGLDQSAATSAASPAWRSLLHLSFFAVSFDMFVMRFREGDTVPMPSAAFDVFLPHVVETAQEGRFRLVRTSDGGEAEIYGEVTPETFSGFMISRFSAGAVLDLLAEFVHQADAVIMPAGGAAMLASESQRQHLPVEFRDEALVVLDGRDIEQAIESG